MRKLKQSAWNIIGDDYKLIKNEQKYAMVDSTCLEPVEIDNENGEYYVKFVFKIYDGAYDETLYGIYNPKLSKEDNFKKEIAKTVHYNETYKYFIDNNKFTILSIIERE